MEFFTNAYNFLQNTFGGSIWVLMPIVGFILVVAQWRLFSKAGQPGIQAIIPFWNFVGLMRIVGRPSWHSAFVIAPLLMMISAMMFGGQEIVEVAASGFSDFSNAGAATILFAASAFAFVVFMFRVHIDLCNSFGRNTVVDYVMMFGLNVLYVLYMGLDYEIEYDGPSYGRSQAYSENQAYA